MFLISLLKYFAIKVIKLTGKCSNSPEGYNIKTETPFPFILPHWSHTSEVTTYLKKKKSTNGLTLYILFSTGFTLSPYLGPNLLAIPIVLPHCFNAI